MLEIEGRVGVKEGPEVDVTMRWQAKKTRDVREGKYDKLGEKNRKLREGRNTSGRTQDRVT